MVHRYLNSLLPISCSRISYLLHVFISFQTLQLHPAWLEFFNYVFDVVVSSCRYDTRRHLIAYLTYFIINIVGLSMFFYVFQSFRDMPSTAKDY